MNRDRWYRPPPVILDAWRDLQMAASPRTVEALYGPKALFDLLDMQELCDRYGREHETARC